MSSGEKAKPPAIKPPATYEERNPFDISRRSEKDIAAEIAQRMAAWKQARGRSYATPSTVPSGEARLPPISAPVQPARPPKSGGHATPAPQPREAEARHAAPTAAPTAAKPAQSGTRAPLFATLSAMRRAMPPAPSLKRPIARPESPTATPANAAAEIEAPETATPKIETVEAAATQSAVPAPVESMAERADIATVDAAVEAPETSSPLVNDGAAETLQDDAPLEAPMPDDDARAAGQRDVDSSSCDAPATLATEARDLSSIHASAMPEIEPAAPEAEAPEVEAPIAESGRIELSAPVIPSVDTLEAATRRIEGRERREPTFAAPATPSIEAHDIEADPVQEDEIEAPVAESGRMELVAPAMPSIEELEAVTHRIEGRERKEPTFDEPAAERPAVEDAAPAPLAAEQPDKAARTGTRAVALPSIETRIETRRIESLRADPQMAGRRPIFPHIDPEEWPSEQPGERDIPPVVAARAQHQPRGGTGWAISLGAILLIAGITAPAAIWQGRQQVPADQDQLVMLPVPASPSKPETKPAAQATLPAAPQPETSRPETMQPEITRPPVTSAEAPSAPPLPPEVAPPAPDEQTTLSAVRSGGELNEAPITTPPAPVLDLASKPKVQFPQAQSDVAAGDVPFPPAARPFVPEPGTPQGAKPFLPTQAGASVPVNSTALPAGTQAGSQTASIALKPNLMGQLKPKAPAVRAASTTPKPVSRKPKPFFQQSPDQMFETLIRTLSEGQPANPATKPTPPSTRK
jgi:hypothetical protein